MNKADKLKRLIEQRRKKYEQYQQIPANNWKKRLRKIELDTIDLKIKRERLILSKGQ